MSERAVSQYTFICGHLNLISYDLYKSWNTLGFFSSITYPEALLVHRLCKRKTGSRLDSTLRGSFSDLWFHSLQDCLLCDYITFRFNRNCFPLQVRFLSDLVNCHVIAAPSMVAMFENFVSVTQEEDVPQVRKPLMLSLVHTVLGGFHLVVF